MYSEPLLIWPSHHAFPSPARDTKLCSIEELPHFLWSPGQVKCCSYQLLQSPASSRRGQEQAEQPKHTRVYPPGWTALSSILRSSLSHVVEALMAFGDTEALEIHAVGPNPSIPLASGMDRPIPALSKPTTLLTYSQ